MQGIQCATSLVVCYLKSAPLWIAAVIVLLFAALRGPRRDSSKKRS